MVMIAASPNPTSPSFCGRKPLAAVFRISSLAIFMTLAACAHTPPEHEAASEADGSNDPAESVNRTIFAGNQFVDRHLLKPTAQAYLDYIPASVRHRVHNFVANLHEPEVLVNDILQGNIRRASVTSQRFVIDSTLGVGGLFDVATDWGLPDHSADFGQTFGVWGVGPGPSVQLPLFGPSNVRDTVGKVAGIVASPLGQISSSVMSNIDVAGGVFGAVDGRADLIPTTDSLERTSLDYYAALRSLMAQRRAALVREGREGKVTAHPAIDPENASPALEAVP
jgi:phospholipid-binding lipoprotein MlaA